MNSPVAPIGLAVLTLVLPGCTLGHAPGTPIPVAACATSRTEEVALVQRSNAFKVAMREVSERAGADTIDNGLGHWGSGVPTHSGWACREMRRESFGGFYGLTVVRATIGSGVRQIDIVFGTQGRTAWQISGWIEDLDSARIDTTGWNAFIRARLNLNLQSTGELTALNCVLDSIVHRYYTEETCWRPDPITITSVGATFTLTGSNGRYRIATDGALLESPTWSWYHW